MNRAGSRLSVMSDWLALKRLRPTVVSPSDLVPPSAIGGSALVDKFNLSSFYVFAWHLFKEKPAKPQLISAFLGLTIFLAGPVFAVNY